MVRATHSVVQVVGEYVYELREEVEAEEVLEKVTALMNREYEGEYVLPVASLFHWNVLFHLTCTSLIVPPVTYDHIANACISYPCC